MAVWVCLAPGLSSFQVPPHSLTYAHGWCPFAQLEPYFVLHNFSSPFTIKERKFTMPVLCWNTTIRARDARTTLKLDVSYRYQLGVCSDTTISLKRPLPSCIDVLSCSDLAFSVAATVDNQCWSGAKLKQSVILTHIVQYFRRVSE